MDERKDLRSAIKPLCSFSNIFYFFMFGVRNDQVVVSKFKSIVSGCFLIICSAIKCWKTSQAASGNYEQWLVNLSSYLFVGFCAASHINLQAHSRSLAKIYNDILPLADLITETSFYRKTFLFSSLQLLIPHLTFFVYFISYYHFYPEDFVQDLFVLESCIDYFIAMHFCGVTVFFSNGLLFGWKVISVANEELVKLRKIEHHKDTHCWNGCPFLKVRSQMKMIKNDELSVLVGIHERLCTSSEELNAHFGVSLTTSSLRNLMDMILSCYFIIKHGFVAVKLISVWFFFCFLLELSVIYACEKFLKETKRTGDILGLLVTESSSQVLKDGVQRFSQHLLHRQLKFTACGLFDLNYKFLFSVFSNMITYLTIVVQFDKAS